MKRWVYPLYPGARHGAKPQPGYSQFANGVVKKLDDRRFFAAIFVIIFILIKKIAYLYANK